MTNVNTLRGYVRRFDLFKEHAGAAFLCKPRLEVSSRSVRLGSKTSAQARFRCPETRRTPQLSGHRSGVGDVLRQGIDVTQFAAMAGANLNVGNGECRGAYGAPRGTR